MDFWRWLDYAGIQVNEVDKLPEVALEQMKFPAWRSSNPARTERVRRAIAAAEAAKS